MLEILEQGHAQVTGVMARGADPFGAITLCYVDRPARELVVGVAGLAGGSVTAFRHWLTCLLGHTPVRLISARPERAMANTHRIRPVVGGLQMVVTKNYIDDAGTITVACTFNYGGENRAGVLVSGHVVGKTNKTVYQNVKGAPNNIGKSYYVTDWKTGSCDAAFVAKNAGTDLTYGEIWTAAGPYLRVTATAGDADLAVGTAVKMHGISATVPYDGQIVATGATVRFKVGEFDDEQTLTNQVLASYTSVAGDSGGPVFAQAAGSSDVTFCGINVGSCTKDNVLLPEVPAGTFAIFSPWSEIDAAFGAGNLNVLAG